jgi:hypothetical protein
VIDHRTSGTQKRNWQSIRASERSVLVVASVRKYSMALAFVIPKHILVNVIFTHAHIAVNVINNALIDAFMLTHTKRNAIRDIDKHIAQKLERVIPQDIITPNVKNAAFVAASV